MQHGKEGFLLVVVLFMVLVLTFFLGCFAYVWSLEIRRNQEALLRYELKEMRVGVTAYYAKNQAYPSTVKDLFLARGCRKDYVDPISHRKDFVIDATSAKIVYVNNNTISLEGDKYSTW